MPIIRRVGKAAKNIPPAFLGFARGIRHNFRISAGSPGHPLRLPGAAGVRVTEANRSLNKPEEQ
jgi:hypothetical protein